MIISSHYSQADMWHSHQLIIMLLIAILARNGQTTRNTGMGLVLNYVGNSNQN